MLNDIEEQPLKQNWALSVKKLLSRLGFMDVWIFQGVGNVKLFIDIFKLRLRDIFMQDWHSRLENSTRSRFFIHIANFQYQTYLDKVSVVKYRKSLSQLRLSSHRLEIEIGRWAKPNKIPLDDRKCKLCNSLEDECHFVLECPLYAALRKQLIDKYFWKRPSMLKLVELFTTENVKILKKLSIFVEKAFKLRKEIMSV